MINANLNQFLDTGWYSESTIYLNGHIYWCEAQCCEQSNITTFFVDKWEASNEDDLYYHSMLESDGSLKWERVLEITDSDLDRIKLKFLEAPIFDGKSFWQVEKQLAWLDESSPITKQS